MTRSERPQNEDDLRYDPDPTGTRPKKPLQPKPATPRQPPHANRRHWQTNPRTAPIQKYCVTIPVTLRNS